MVEKVDTIVLCKDSGRLQQGQAGLERERRGESCVQLGLEPAACLCVHACVLMFQCLYIPALSRLGVEAKIMLVLPALTLLKLNSPWFIFRYFLYPGMPHLWLCPLLFALPLLPASLSITLRFHHVLSFHVDGGCSWIYGFLHGGLTFRGRLKMISQPAV